jgi:hypothetical protein
MGAGFCPLESPPDDGADRRRSRESGEVRPFVAELKAINCHHNYVARERHYGQNILVTERRSARPRRRYGHGCTLVAQLANLSEQRFKEP